MSRIESLVIRPEYVEYVREDTRGGRPTDKIPNGTYITNPREEGIRIVVYITYIPLAFFMSSSMTSCLSEAFHLRMSRFVCMTDLTYSAISLACPFSP